MKKDAERKRRKRAAVTSRRLKLRTTIKAALTQLQQLRTMLNSLSRATRSYSLLMQDWI